MGWLAWFLDRTVGWFIDRTLGAVVRRARRPDERRTDLAALADAISEAASGCHKLGRGYLQNTAYGLEATAHAERALSISTRITDDDLARLTKAARDGVRDYAEAFMERDRSTYREPCDAVLERIRRLQR